MTEMLHTEPISRPAGEPPRVIAADAGALFAARARRFEALAAGHALGDWLRFLGRLTAAQHAAMRVFPEMPLPDAALLARAREHGMPPLPAQAWPRDPAWRAALRCIAEDLAPQAPPAAVAALARLRALDADALEGLAGSVLRAELYGNDAALLPFVAAALQVCWTALASRLGAAGIAPLDVPGVCPCCGFLPVASVLRSGGAVAGLRYLHCALCNTEWNLVRVKCAACDGTAGIGYRQIEGVGVKNAGTVRAETCEACKAYLKIVRQDTDPDADPVADDLATLALDLLVDEAGYQRIGPNLLFVPGEAA